VEDPIGRRKRRPIAIRQLSPVFFSALTVIGRESIFIGMLAMQRAIQAHLFIALCHLYRSDPVDDLQHAEGKAKCQKDEKTVAATCLMKNQ